MNIIKSVKICDFDAMTLCNTKDYRFGGTDGFLYPGDIHGERDSTTRRKHFRRTEPTDRDHFDPFVSERWRLGATMYTAAAGRELIRVPESRGKVNEPLYYQSLSLYQTPATHNGWVRGRFAEELESTALREILWKLVKMKVLVPEVAAKDPCMSCVIV